MLLFNSHNTSVLSIIAQCCLVLDPDVGNDIFFTLIAPYLFRIYHGNLMLAIVSPSPKLNEGWIQNYCDVIKHFNKPELEVDMISNSEIAIFKEIKFVVRLPFHFDMDHICLMKMLV